MKLALEVTGISQKELDEISKVLKQPDSIRIRKVWTRGYNPWIMGGDVHAPIGAELPALGPFPIGRGYSVYLVLSPKGVIHAAEASSGAFVGMTLEEIREDVRTGDTQLMARQVVKAQWDSKQAVMLEPDEFWSRFRGER